MKIIKNVKPNTDTYVTSEVNCYEKPIAIAVDAYKKESSHFFYLYIKMLQAYNISFDKYSQAQQFPILKASKDIVSELFGFELKEISIESNLHEAIMNELDNDHIVLIPGNLRELFYSAHYKTSNWNHLFLIKGYDEVNRLYYINDSIHIHSEDSSYLDFVLPFDIMANMFYEILVEDNRMIHSLYVPDNYQADFHLIAKAFFDAYFQLISFDCFKEELQLRELISEGDKKDIAQDLKRINQHKKVFLKELISALRLITNDEKLLKELENHSAAIIDLWEVISNRAVINAYSNKAITYSDKLATVKALEAKLHEMLTTIYDRLFIKMLDAEPSKPTFDVLPYKFNIENDEDSIIKINNNSVSFIINNGKLYDSWFEDNALKIMFDNNCYNPESVEISTRVRLVEASDFPYLMAGIALRDVKEKLYFWGICNALKVVLDLSGINGNICSHNITQRDIILKLRLKDKKLSLLFSNYDINPEFILVDTIELSDNIKELGIGCKTWKSFEPLSVEFSDINILPI